MIQKVWSAYEDIGRNEAPVHVIRVCDRQVAQIKHLIGLSPETRQQAIKETFSWGREELNRRHERPLKKGA